MNGLTDGMDMIKAQIRHLENKVMQRKKQLDNIEQKYRVEKWEKV